MSIIFGGYLALGQSDIKRLIAYSSVGHMGFVTLGIFLLNDAGIKGAILQMVNHGVTTASFAKYKVVGGLAVIGAILAAAYMLRMVQKMVWADSDGHRHADEKTHLFDLNFREAVTLAFLTVFVFWIGLNPKPFLAVMDTSTAHLLQQLEAGMHALPGEHHAHLSGLGATVKGLLAFR